MSSTNGNAKPKIVHVLEAKLAESVGPLVQLLVRNLAQNYAFAIIGIGPPGSLAHGWPLSGQSVHLLERKPGLDWRCSCRLAALLQRERADLVHTHQSAALFFGLFARLQYAHASILCTEHDRPHPDSPSPRRAVINRLLIESRDRVVAASRSVRQALILNEGLLPEQVDVIYNGVSMLGDRSARDVEVTRSELGLEADRILVLQSAPFDLWQNQSLAIQALAQVVRVLPEVHLALVGDGPELATLRAMVAQRDLESHVSFHGPLPDGDRLLRAADIVLSTSIGKAMTSHMIRALALGRPVVATRVGTVAEIIEDRVSGFLVNADDYGALGEMIVRLGSSPNLREQFGSQGRRRAFTLFSEKLTLECYDKIYKEMTTQLHKLG